MRGRGAWGPQWDFQLPNVHSINASGHKFGLVYPGLGWCIFRSKKCATAAAAAARPPTWLAFS